jgi:hypothetical protein
MDKIKVTIFFIINHQNQEKNLNYIELTHKHNK